MKTYEGGCLCGAVRYRAKADPVFPHLCSCTVCRRWSGAPTVAWVEFPLSGFEWTGEEGEPHFFRSSDRTERGNCPRCGSAICAVDDGYANISIVLGSLDEPDAVIPDEQHSHSDSKPRWWRAEVKPPAA